jgi:predicted ribosome quality control (RQC) complex YloA/Tae2 family protein
LSLSFLELEQIVSEINRDISDGFVQHIQQPDEHSIILTVRIPSLTKKLFISAKEHFSRIHFLDEKTRIESFPSGNLLPFAAKLRKEIQGLKISRIRCLFGDRVAAIEFFRREQEPQFSLIFECSGHHPNIFLTDEENTIIFLLKKSRSFKRDLRIGRRYQKPIPRTENVVSSSRFADSRTSISSQIQSFYEKIEENRTVELKITGLKKTLKHLLEHEKNKMEKIKMDLKNAGEADKIKNSAEILKDHLNDISCGAKEFIHEGLHILLDPKISPSENMKNLFERYKKLKGAVPMIENRLNRCRETVAAVENLTDQAENLQKNPDLIPEMERKLKDLFHFIFPHDASGDKKPERKCYREFRGRDGTRILAGREGRDNENLTFRIARGNDLFFHATNRAGSHVILITEKGKDPSFEAIYDAAVLAAYFSKARGESKVEVTYTECKYVKKARSREKSRIVKPGSVIIQCSRTIMVNMDEKFIDKLLTTHTG